MPSHQGQRPELAIPGLVISEMWQAAYLVAKKMAALGRDRHEHHPGTDFFVFLADRDDGYLDESADRSLFTIVPIEEVGIPGIGSFIYRYSVIELNTAVKPYVLEYLPRKHSADTVFYIDPDVWIFRRFEEVFCALEARDIPGRPAIAMVIR